MDARFLLVTFDAAYVLALAAWVGSVLFVSFGVAPWIFKVLDAAAAGRFVRALFPVYYAWGATWGGVALAALVCGALTHPELRGPRVAVQAGVLLASILTMFYAGNTLTPAINAARDAGPAAHDRFERLHRRSVRLNTLVLLAGLALLIAFAARPVPRSAGITEPTPQQRLQQALDRERQKQKIYEDAMRRGLPGRTPRRPPS